eukprot:gene13723-15154_t
MTAESSLEAFRNGAWSCELNKRLNAHLRNELRQRDKLLKYREKVINKLRKTILQLNLTRQGQLNNTAARGVRSVETANKEGEIVDTSRDQFHNSTTDAKEGPSQDKLKGENPENKRLKVDGKVTVTVSPTPFPENLDKIASARKRPCCVGLNRITNILRKYMDLNANLRQKIVTYEKLNITEKLVTYGEAVKKRTIARNCSTMFIPRTVEKEKDGMFLSTDMLSVYETVPLYLKPKQKLGNFGAKHRNLDLKTAFTWALSELEKKTKHKADLSSNFDVLFKTDALKGNQYQFVIKSQDGKVFNVPVLRPLGPYMLDGAITDQSVRRNELINIIVPLSQRVDRLESFLEMIKSNSVEKLEYVFLTFVLYGNVSSTRELKLRINKFSAETGFTQIDVFQRDLPFSRGRALNDGVRRWNGNPNVLLFFCDVDVTFDAEFLHRCRMYTEAQKKVYYPILFSMYNPKLIGTVQSEKEINSETGTWRPLGFGMACMHRLDYNAVGGFNLSIEGWGGEDNDLFTRFLKSRIKIIRAPDPGLFHKWHPKHCDESLDKIKYNHCLGAKARYEASQRQLGLLLFNRNSTLT